MSGVTAERLLAALWKDPNLVREAISLLSIERIALPWRRVSRDGCSHAFERRSIAGSVVASCWGTVGAPEPAAFKVHLPGAPEYERGRDVAGVMAGADRALSKLGWLTTDIPALGPWEIDPTHGWVRRTALGSVAAWVRPVPDQPRQFLTYVLLDERVVRFEGTDEKARSVVDRNLEHLGFRL